MALVACRFNATETLSTVRFGSRAKDIKNKPKVNVMRSMREMEQLLDNANKQISRQNKVIGALQNAVTQYRALLKSKGIEDTVAPDDTFLERLASNPSGNLGALGDVSDSEDGKGTGKAGSSTDLVVSKKGRAEGIDVKCVHLFAMSVGLFVVFVCV
jgi:hypothetical protein